MAENSGAAVVVTVFTPRPEARGELVEALREFLPGVHREEGCLLYALHDADDGTIVLQIAPSVEDVQGHGPDDMPVVGSRRVQTTVRVRDGETIAIGGLLQEVQVENHSRVPLLGHLPIFGRLFSSSRTTTEENEVLIFITPRIVREDHYGGLH